MTNPHEPPSRKQGHSRDTPKKRSQLTFAGVVLLGIAVTMPILGVLGTIIGMMFSFKDLAESDLVSPNGLASNIGLSLGTTAIGLALGVVLAIAGVACIILGRRNTSGADSRTN
jgi:biopolymer transport protein ExbB/TolQ